MDGVSLARACLAVSEDSHDSLVEDEVHDGSNLEEVELLIGVVLIKGVVKLEVGVLNGLCHSVYFVSAVVNHNFGIDHTDDINLAIGQLVLEDWPLLEAD